MKIIETNDALKPKGHYSQAIEHDGIIYVSGILPFDHKTGNPVVGDVKMQAKEVLINLKRIVEAGGSNINKILKVVIYTPDIKYWDEINELYQEFFGDHKPARCIVPTNGLHFDFHIEIEAIAYC